MGPDITYDKQCNFIFGSYAEDNDDCKITNETEEQTVSGIYLGPTAKFQWSYKIFFLRTGHVVTHKHNIREIPIPTWVIQHVEALVARNLRDLTNGNKPLFNDRFFQQ